MKQASKACGLCDGELCTEEQVVYGLCCYHLGYPTPIHIAETAERDRERKILREGKARK